jgi:hypothetical protein
MTDRLEETLILKRNPEARYTESYNVLFEGRYVGRIYKAISHAPREAPWFWGLPRMAGERWTSVRQRRQSRSERATLSDATATGASERPQASRGSPRSRAIDRG